MKRQYKVLPCPIRFLWLGVFVPEDYFGADYREIPCVFGRDGWYYDRASKLAWVEFGGHAYLDKRNDDFLWHLKCLNHKPLSDVERAAIRTLQIYGICPPALHELIYADDNERMLRGIRRDGLSFRLKLDKEEKAR